MTEKKQFRSKTPDRTLVLPPTLISTGETTPSKRLRADARPFALAQLVRREANHRHEHRLAISDISRSFPRPTLSALPRSSSLPCCQQPVPLLKPAHCSAQQSHPPNPPHKSSDAPEPPSQNGSVQQARPRRRTGSAWSRQLRPGATPVSPARPQVAGVSAHCPAPSPPSIPSAPTPPPARPLPPPRRARHRITDTSLEESPQGAKKHPQ